MTIRLLFFRSFFINLWVGDFGKPDWKQSQPGWFWMVLYQNQCAGRSLLRKSLVQLQIRHHLLHLLHLCIAWLCSGSETGKETPQINCWPYFFASAPVFLLPIPFPFLGERLKLANTSWLSCLYARFCWMCAMEKGPEFHRCSHRSTDFKGNLAIYIFPFQHPCHRSSVLAWPSLKLVSACWVVFFSSVWCAFLKDIYKQK